MSSSVADGFEGFVWAALDALSRARSDCYARLARVVADLPLRLFVQGERVQVVARRGRFVRWSDGDAAVTVRTTPRAILALVDGEETLLDAVVAGRLDACGAVDALTAAHDGLMIFLEGAVRCPSFPGLMRDFRQWAAARGEP